MNKLCYRIVFNKARGLCMAVQETARSHGKGAGQAGPAGTAASGGLATRLRSLARALLGAFGGTALLAGLASAQIIADPSASGRQQATVLNAANGVLQVNIQTPSVAGVSRNVYSRFDVPKTGAVLNNSRTAVQSQLGGWIDANPWMAHGTARVILNEVNSNDPSQLRGYIEVAGARAETVIANPAGIVVDGAGFINVSRATLTTGKPLLDQADGALRGYAVRGGMINIGGAGLDARQTDYTALIARSVQLNAGLWAQQLEVTTGVNDIALAADGAAPGNAATPVAAGGEVPRYGIDASQLGGMYANKITLVGTEAGVGVRNAGALGAAAGELVVTTEGRLENTGSLAASLALSAAARDGVVNSGGISAGGALTMSTPAAVSNSGTINGAAGLQLTAAGLSNSNLISSSGRAALALTGDIDNSHGVIQAQSLALSSGGGINNQSGKLLQTAAVALDVAVAGLHNANGGQVGAAPSTGADGSGANAGNGADGGTGNAGTGNGSGSSDSGANSGAGNGTGSGSGGDNGSGSNSGSGNGATPPAPVAPGFLHAAGALNNDGGQILSGGGIALTATSLDNSGGQMNLSSLAVNGGAFSNHGAQLNVQRGASIHGTSFDNHDGKLVAGAGVDVRVQGLDNGNGLMSAGTDLALDSAAIVNRDGKLVAGAQASITAAGALDNHGGQIQAITGLALKASGKLDNQSGVVETIGAAGAMQVLASEIDNSKGRIANAGNGASDVGVTGNLLNSGTIGANGALTVSALTLQNQAGGGIQSTGAMALAVRRQLDNLGGIASGGALSFDESGATLSNAGQMAAGGDIHIAVRHAGNDGGQIGTAAASGASLSLSAADISNRGGSLLADRDVGVSAAQGGLDNSKGLIHARNDASVNAAQTLLNQDGVIEAVSAGSKLSLDTGAIRNLGGRIVNAGSGDSNVAAKGAIVSDGLIAGNGSMAVTAATVTNSGTLSSAGAFKLAVTEQLDNSSLISSGGAMELGNASADMRNTGQVYAVGDIGVQARNVVNAGQIATTAAGGGITLRGAMLDNHGGSIAASGAVDLRVDGALNNAGGLVQAGRDLGIAVKDTLDNSAGVIEAIGTGSAMRVNAGAIVNVAGRIANVGTGDTAIAADGDIQNSGLIAGNGVVDVASSTMHNNAAGALTSGKQMTLAVEQLLQNDGSIRSAAALDFSKTTAVVGNSGSIIADGAMLVRAGLLVNDGGQISTTQDGGADLAIDIQQLRNYRGRILAAGSAGINVAGAVDNRSGAIQGAQGLSLSAGGALDNSSGTIEAMGAGGTLTVQANGIDNTAGSIVGAGSASINSVSYVWNSGRIGANGELALGAASVFNTGAASITAGAGLGLSVRDLLDNHGLVSSYGLLHFDLVTGQVNNDGQIVSGGGINLKAGDLNNDKGQISTVKQSQTDVSIVANSASNQGGTIVGDRNAALIVTGALNNAQGVIQAGKDMQASVGAALTNTTGVIEATGATSALNVQAGSIDNTGGRIVNVGTGASSVGAQGTLVNGGLIAGNGGLSVTAATLQNSAAATISAGKDLALGVTRQLDNQGAISSGGKLDFTQVTAAVRNGGTIASGGATSINAGTFNNDGGQLATVRGSGADIALNAQSLSNRSGVIQSDRSVAAGVAYTVDNAHGTIQARQDLQFAAGSALNNNSGVIEAIGAGSALRVQAGSIDNSAGRIVNVGNAAASVLAQDAIVNSGLIAGNGTLDLAAGSLQNQAGGTVSSGAAMDLAVTQQLDNQGAISSGGTLEFSKTTGVVNNSGQMVAAGQVHVAAGVLNNDGGQIATLKDSGSSIAIDSQSLSNQGGSVVASGSATLAVAGAANNAHGTIQAQRDLQLTAGGALNNTGGTIEAVTAASSLSVQASAIDNSAGRMVNVGTGAATVSATGLITNSGLIAGNGSLDLAAGSLRNQAGGNVSSGLSMGLGVAQQLDNQGAINSGGSLTFSQTTAVVNNSGQIASAGQASIAAGSLNNDGGLIATLPDSGSGIAITSQSLSNRGGRVQASGDAVLDVGGAVDNTQGTLQAGQDMRLSAGGTLSNNAGVIEALAAGSAMRVQAGDIANGSGRIVNVGSAATSVSAQGGISSSGLIAGNGTLDLAADSLQNQTGGTVSSGAAMDLAVTRQLDNQGAISSGGTLEFSKTTGVVNNSGQMVAAGRVHVAAGALNNDGGQIATLKDSGSSIAIDSQSLSNQGGSVVASGSATLAVAGAANNAHGTIQAQRDLQLTAGGALNNTGGTIEAVTAASSLSVQASAIDNSAGRMVNVGAGAATVSATGLITNSGLIAGNGSLDLAAGSLRNQAGGNVSSGLSMGLGVAQQLDNQGAINSGGSLTFSQTTAVVNNSGQIASAGQASIAAGSLNNDGGLIATLPNSGSGIAITSQSLSNRGGRVQASGDAVLGVGGAVDNTQGTLQAGQDMRLSAGGTLSNNAGVIEALAAGSAMRVQAGDIANGSGRIVNVGSAATSVSTQGGISSSGTIAGNGTLDLGAQSLQNTGAISAGGQMTLSLSQLLDNHGAIRSGGALTSTQTTAQVNNSGTMTAAGAISMAAGSLNNDGGQIATLSNSGADIDLGSQSMSNRGGSVLASGSAGVNVSGALDNTGGTLQAGRDMQLTVGGALGNAGGVIEALSAVGAMTVQGQSIDNSSGRIVNVGSGDTRIVSQSSLVSSGMIAGNGNLLLAAQSAQNKAGGTLASGGNLELEVTGQMQNQGAVSSAGILDFVQAGASFSNSGQMVSGGTATFSAASFSNDGGQIATTSASGADIGVTSQSISNHGGKIVASGNTTLSSDSGLDNNAGTLQAGKNLKLGAIGAVGNAGGTIEADGGASTLELTAATLDSSGGRIVNVGTGDTTLLIATDLVNSGLLAANGNLNLTAQTLKNNTGGAIGSAGKLLLAVSQQVDNHAAITSTGALTFQQAGANLNNDGQMVAGGAMTIVAKAINNNNGQIATAKSSGADLALTAASLSNEKGKILADGKAVLAITGALDNVQGTIQSGKDMQVNAGGALTNNGGAIEAAGATSALTLRALSIDNGTGRIVNAGSGDTTITSLGGVSNAGVIAGGGNLLLNATTLQNAATGMVASGKDMTLRLTQLLDNQGTINSAGTLTFNQAGANLNNSGLIVSGGDALIVANQINNNGGRLGTGAGSSGDLSLTTQQLSNEGGHITTGRDLSVSTHVMQGSGELQGGRDLALSMDGDYTQGSGTQQFHSNRDLSLTVTGNIVNTATFEAAGKLTLSGNNVSNNAGAVMQGQGVAVNAAGNLSNAGQINGTATVDLKSGGTLDNSNAIVGGNLTLLAQNLNNTGASTLLGSTGAMTLDVAGTLNNTGGASIYSGGSLAIAAAPGGGATGLVNNISSTIEAAGDLSLNAASVNNIRENVTLVKVQTVDETKQMYLPSWSHHGDNHNNYDPNSSNYVPSELYYVNPDDVLEDKLMFAPDGNMYGRAVIRTHANDSAFFWAASGAYSAQGERLRISMSDGTRVLYYMVRKDNMANPDQGGPTDTPTDLYLGAVNSWHSAPIAFSSQYGNCSTNCVRFETQPDYNDPTTEIIRVSARAVAPQSGKLEQSRLAHHTAVEDQIAPGSGAEAQILSGGNMHLTVGQALTNQYGQIMATGALAIDGGAAITNQGATLYRNHTFDGTWKTDDGEVVAYTMPSQSEIIGSAAGVISGGKGVSIAGRSFSNVDVTAGTVGNIRDSVTVLPTGNNSASAASHATGNGASGGSAGGHVGGSGIGNNASGAGTAGGSGIGNNAGGAHVAGGSGIGNNAAGAGAAGGSGIANQAARANQAGGSGADNNAALGGLAGDSGLANQAAEAGQAAGSGIGNQARARLDAGASAIYNGARELDKVNVSGKTSTATTSGAAQGSGASGKALGDVSTGHGASLALNAADSGAVVKVAPNGLSLLNPNANGSYVFETRPQFANHGDWISSDYLLKALDTDPAVTQKRLGDGFYEQRLVRDQLIELTGRAPTGGQSDDSRYKELLTSGISVAQQYGLRPGIALSADQVSHLTSDIVWMETETVSLPDGTVENVLVPKVYLAHAGAGAVKASGALVTGDGVDIRTTDNIVNRGGLIDGANGRTVLVAGQDIVNQGGTVKGGAMDLQAGRDVINQSLTVKQEYASVNTSGSYTTLSNQAGIAAGGALTIKAGRDVTDTGGGIAGASVAIGAGRDASFNALQTGSTYASQVAGFTEKDSTTTYKTGQVASSGDLKLVAGQDIKLSGTQVAIGATGNGTLVAGRDVTLAAVVNEVNISKQNDPGSKLYDKEVRQDQTVVGASVTAGGNLAVKAGDSGLGNLALAGSNLAGGGKVQLAASGDVNITQVQEVHLSDLAHHDESSSMFKKSSNTSADYSNVSKVVGSGVSGDSVTVKSDKDIVIRGSELSATGALTLNAGRDLLVSSAQQTDSENHSEEHQRSGFSFNPASGALGYSKSDEAKARNGDTVTQVGSVLSGGSVSTSSGRDTVISGSTVVADKDIAIDAGRNLSIVSAENSSTGASSTSSKKSGSIGTTFQPAVGTVKSATDGTNASVTQVGSQIASLGGDVSLKAGEHYTQTASEVKAPQGDIDITAKDVLINAAMNSANSSDHTSYSKTAIGGSVNVPLVDALKSANSMVNAAKNTSDSRMQALAALNTAGSLVDAYKAYDTVTKTGIKVSISLGNQKSDSTVVHTSETAVGSTITAGGDVTIRATGAGKDSNLTAIGSDIKAGQDVSLSADNQVNLLAARNTASQHSTNSSSSSSIGIGFGIGGTSNGFTIDLAVSQARGKADGDDVGYTNSHVTAGSQVNVHSGGDTTLKGGVIAAPTVVADIGGNLNIESLQDSSKYNSKQSSAGLNASLCIPPFCYGASTVGGSIGKSHVDGDFLSVLEQSGIKAGDGGFQVAVNGNTDLKGGLLSSSQKAIDQGSNVLMTGSLTSSDLQNKDHYDAGGFALSGSISGKMGDQSKVPENVSKNWTEEQKTAAAADGKPGGGAGFGSASGDQGSTTASGISGGLIAITDQAKQLATGKDASTVVADVDRDVTTESAAAKAGSLTKGWDAKQLQKDVDAQVAITTAFGQAAAKKVGDFADAQRDEALARGDELTAEKWSEGGEYRVAAHAAIGAVAGGTGGALGAGISALTAPKINELIGDIGLPDDVRKLVIAAASSGAAALAGDAGLVSGYNQVENNFLKHEQAAAMRKEFDQCDKKATGCTDAEYVSIRDKYLALSNKNIAQIQSCVFTGNVACVSSLEGQAATSSELGRDLVGADFTIFAGRQNNVLSYQSVNGAASLFGTDVQQAAEVAKFRLSHCVGLTSASCDVLVKDALANQKARVGILMAASTVIPLVTQATINGLRTLKLPTKTTVTQPTESPASNKGTPDALLPDADFAGQFVPRPDLEKHLIDATVSGKQISGGHDMESFKTALNDAGGTEISRTEVAPGIYEVEYQLPKAKKSAEKTLFDPKMYPDMPAMTSAAANKALMNYQITGEVVQKVTINGMKFNVNIKVTAGAPATVRTAYPIGKGG
ncbi:hemagglutinin repeat-containing protein [Rugamonas sp. A1-17]|nr:hemagglutinin repeat-containing protein [Rugamonas sp. A1-17]